MARREKRSARQGESSGESDSGRSRRVYRVDREADDDSGGLMRVVRVSL